MEHALPGRRILVTGASSGVGAATAAVCVRSGARVALLARRVSHVQGLAAELGDAAIATPADVRDEAAVARAVSLAAEHLGGLDGVVHAAGLNRAALLADGTAAHWREMLETNLLGAFIVTQATLPHLVAAGGADVLAVSSMSGRRVLSPAMGVYAATKAGLSRWAEALWLEVADRDIRVMLLSPGFIDTEFAEQTVDPDLRADNRARLAQTGLDPAEVAAEITHMLARPRHVRLGDVTIMPTAQRH
ncbi:MAG TPA: SDR family oxidoreductase [Streptosporangiaceae bacterium]